MISSSSLLKYTSIVLFVSVALRAEHLQVVQASEGESSYGSMVNALGSAIGSGSSEGGALGGLEAGLGGLSDGLATFIGGSSSSVPAPAAPASKPVEKKYKTVGSGKSDDTNEKDLDIIKDPGEFIKTLLNPVEFVKALSVKFKLHFDKLAAALGKPLLFGLEVALTPFTTTIKIIETVFVPDDCRLHFVCTLGSNISFLKEHVPKFSPKFSEGSSLIKAFGAGILGEKCASKFACETGEPKLRKEFEVLKKEQSPVSKI